MKAAMLPSMHRQIRQSTIRLGRRRFSFCSTSRWATSTGAASIAPLYFIDVVSPVKIPAIRYAVQRNLYPNYKFKLVGMTKLPQIHFRKPTKGKTLSRLRSMFKREQPIVCDTKKCIQCGTCAEHCPVKAIKMHPYPDIDKRKCIRCFCCMEVCPVHALSLGKPGDPDWKNFKEH